MPGMIWASGYCFTFLNTCQRNSGSGKKCGDDGGVESRQPGRWVLGEWVQAQCGKQADAVLVLVRVGRYRGALWPRTYL